MARLTKEEKKVFDPTLLIQNQKWKSDTIKDLMIGEGKEEGGHSPYQPWKPAPGGPYVPAPGKGKELANSPQSGSYPSSPSYINYKEIRDVNPFLIDQFIKDRGLEIFKLQTGIPLAHGDGGGWEHWDAETKKRFLMETDEEYKQWLKENNFIEEGESDTEKPESNLKIGSTQVASNKTPSQQNATNMLKIIKDLERQGKYIESKALYDEQFPKA